MSTSRLVVRALPLVLAAAFAPDAAAQREAAAEPVPRFRLTLLPTPAEVQFSSATAINEQGDVAGTLYSQGPLGNLVQTALWTDPDAQPAVATGLGAANSQAADLNAAGSVIGNGTDLDVGYVSFTWMAGQDVQPLSDVAGVSCDLLQALDHRGVAVGIGTFPELGVRPTRWTDGVPEDLGLLPGDFDGGAFGMSQAGHVVGRSGMEAARWFQGAIERLEFPGDVVTVAFDVNVRGEAVGVALTGPAPSPVLWRKTAGVELPTLGGGSGGAEAINVRSWIVGASQTAPPYGADENMRATLWIGGQALDLNTLTIALPGDVVLAGATDVNDAGQIVGHALIGDTSRGFLLEPAGH